VHSYKKENKRGLQKKKKKKVKRNEKLSRTLVPIIWIKYLVPWHGEG
jgi:hypothetical protein